MFKPLFTLFAATFLLAACETASTISEEAAGTSASDAAASTTETSSTASASSSSSSTASSAASNADNSALEAARADMMSIGDTVYLVMIHHSYQLKRWPHWMRKLPC